MAFECGACGNDFGSLRAFDSHRIGKHAYTSTEGLKMDPPKEDGRRCLHVSEFELHGIVQNARGLFSLRDSLDAARVASWGVIGTSQGHEKGTGSK